jgi:hypothetical protein
LADLFEAGGGVIRPPSIAATYEYIDASGVIVARKVRFVPKAFRWQHPHPKDPNRWLSGYGDVPPGLYRLPDILGCEYVFLCEGEKAVERCWELGLPACCSPAGASRWLDEWTEDLIRAGCGELIVLPDADEPGARHAEKVAASAYTMGLAVKVLPLPGLNRGGDAFDWLEHHRPEELTALAVAAPRWEPGSRDRAREARRRELTRLRVQKYRAKHRANRLRVSLTRGRHPDRFAVTR